MNSVGRNLVRVGSSLGSGKAIAVGVGAAAGGGVLFYALHHRGSVSGCIVSKDDQVSLVDNKNHTYLIVPGAVPVKPGERVQLRGRKSKDEAGTPTFEATKLVKRLGTCGAEPTIASTEPTLH